MDPNQRSHIPQTPQAPAPRLRSPPPPGWVDPNVRRWRVEDDHARIVEGPKSSRPQGDGIFEYAGHLGLYQPSSETIRTRTVRRVPRQGPQQVRLQAPVEQQQVQRMQRTYSAPVMAEGQQAQHQQTLLSPPAAQQGQHMQHTPSSPQSVPIQQPMYQQQQQHQILAQRVPLQQHHSTSRTTHTIQAISSRPVTHPIQHSAAQTQVQPHIVSPPQTTTFTVPAEM
ncbi:hypothetical protein B0A48_01489 [Cryoendolithus antarcticus]|uniref:Uncharacterized protein n=1 Tax=Cryoendolithus antarcticus TaxID=1507870 RepID=A0A1V8TPU2_9PEZI|nr:hypothetical protein B0A48_01489 [Cryoendolithus antarcticus]